MTQLIVALDGDAADMGGVIYRLNIESRLVHWFKISGALLLQHNGMFLVKSMQQTGGSVSLFADLKIYDTADTVYNISRRAFDLGARMLTVHATPSMLEAAMRAKPNGDCKVLAVEFLTDHRTYRVGHGTASALNGLADGAVCGVPAAYWLRSSMPSSRNKILVCPGIRPAGWPSDNHVSPSTPAQAREAGADFIVVGRPVVNADDPVQAVRRIMLELDQ